MAGQPAQLSQGKRRRAAEKKTIGTKETKVTTKKKEGLPFRGHRLRSSISARTKEGRNRRSGRERVSDAENEKDTMIMAAGLCWIDDEPAQAQGRIAPRTRGLQKIG